MAGIEVNVASSKCRKCGYAFGKLKGYFPVSYQYLYRGSGYLPYCRECVDNMYQDYLAMCHDDAKAVRQMCRKLDLYWNEKVYNSIASLNTSRTIISHYISKLNGTKLAGKCYDDTLKDEGTLWVWPDPYPLFRGSAPLPKEEEEKKDEEPVEEDIEIADEVMEFWGPGYTPTMYNELEQRLQYYKSKMEDVQMDIGTEALLRQIVMSEIDINRARAEGKPVDKMVSSLNTLLGSAMLKPTQKKEDVDTSAMNTPFGVWIKRWEDERPTPEIDPELKDVDGIVRYIQIWFFGHLCKMLGIKNTYSRMYEEEINRLRVERPEFDDEDDESMLYDIFGGGENDT